MLKKIVEKRTEVFKEKFPNFQVSKKSNSLYTKIGEKTRDKEVFISGRAVTKTTLDKLGTKVNWKENYSQYVYLLTPKGRLMVSSGGNFKSLSLRELSQRHELLEDIFFIGKKYEWLKNYKKLWEYRLFQSFSSLADAKKFLGFSFISDQDFYDLFGGGWYDYLSVMILAKEKSNAVRLLKNIDNEDKDTLKDYIQMCQDNNIPIEIPAGKNKLQELHDNAMWEINRKNMDAYSKEFRYEITENFTQIWKERGLEFRRLETPYQMYEQGIKQAHCIGTNYSNGLGSYAFYSFSYKDKEYEIQIGTNGDVWQFYGRKNTNPPQELKEKVKTNVDLSFTLKDVNPDVKNYPMNKELVKETEDWLDF